MTKADGSEVDVRLDEQFKVVVAETDREDDDDDRRRAALTGGTLDRASKAALAEAGGGKVRPSATARTAPTYELEVTKDERQRGRRPARRRSSRSR